MLKNTFLNNNENMGEFLFVLHKSCVLPSGCCKVPIRRSRYKSKPSSSEVIRFTQNFVLLKHCWNCRCHQADGHRQSQDASRFCQPSISVFSSGDPFFLQSCVTPTPQYFGQFLFHKLCGTFRLQVQTPRYENWHQGDCWAGDEPPSMDNDSAFQEPDLVNP